MKITCPKFLFCNAPICILDEDWQKRIHHNEDACCFYLLEAQKQGAIALAPEISSRFAPIHRNMERAKTTGSRMTRFPKDKHHD
jgi:hypothetical protein